MMRYVCMTLLVAACGSQGPAPEAATEAADAAEIVKQDDVLRRAASTAGRIAAKPSEATKILAEDGWTREDFEATLYSIAADPDQARRYRDLLAEAR